MGKRLLLDFQDKKNLLKRRQEEFGEGTVLGTLLREENVRHTITRDTELRI